MPTFTNPEDAENELTQLLLRAVPENEHGNKTLDHLATVMGVSRSSVHKWVRRQKMRPSRVVKVVEISEGRVKREEFDPFVYKV